MAPKTKTNRFMELEGLRVVAAFIVVVFHSLLVFYPGYFYGVGSAFAPVQNMRFEDNLFQSPFIALLSGTFAVGVFFVLSGFVLSVGYFQKKDSAVIAKLASKRYLRLMLPALASILIAWIAISLRWSQNMGEVVSVVHSGWLAPLWQFHPNFFEALWQGLAAMFTLGEVNYNPVLWTIQLEFIGSFMVFVVCALFARSKYRWLVYAALIAALMNTWFFGFITGMVLADIYVHRRSLFEKLDRKATYGLVALGIVLGSFPSSENITSPLYKFLSIPGLNLGQLLTFYITIGATLIVVSVLSVTRLRRLFAHPLISNLGKYTYTLYLMHLPVLLTVCTTVFVVALPLGIHKAAIIAMLSSWVVLVPVVFFFEKYIDAPSIRLAGICADIYMGKKELAWDSNKVFRVVKRKINSFRRPKDQLTEIEVE